MKNCFLLVLLISIWNISMAQKPGIADTIPNAGFEYWSSGNQPNNWLVRYTTASISTDKYAGNFALQLQTTLNSQNGPDGGDGKIASLPPSGLEGMQPAFSVTSRHTTLNGFYKFFPVNGDSCEFWLVLSKTGYSNPFNPTSNVVGMGYLCKSSSSEYSPFTVPITYYDSTTIPDSAYITLDAYKEMDFLTMTSNKPLGNSTLYVDNLSFDGFNTPSYWIGGISDEWENAANWSTGVVPVSSTNVFVNKGTPYLPVVRALDSCLTLNVSNGVQVIVNSSYQLTVSGH
jgi:hypothetical protein